MATIRKRQSPRLGRECLHVHACDAVRDLSRGQAFEVELGRGSADLPGLLGRLTEFDYPGWVTIERQNSARSDHRNRQRRGILAIAVTASTTKTRRMRQIAYGVLTAFGWQYDSDIRQ